MGIISEVWVLVRLQVLRVIIILVALSIVPKNFFNVLMTILVVNTAFDLLTQEEVSLKRSAKGWLFTTIFLGSIYLLYKLLGVWGVLGPFFGLAVVILLMAGWALYQNWKIYDAVTTWGAKRIKGKTKEEFNLKEAMKK